MISREKITERLKVPRINMPDEVRAIRARIIQFVLNAAALIGAPIYFINLYTAISNRNIIGAVVFTVSYFVVVALAFVRFIPFEVRAMLTVSIFMLLGIIESIQNGLSGGGRNILLAFIILGITLISTRVGIAAYIIGVITLLVSAVGFSMGWLAVPPIEVNGGSTNPLQWASAILMFLLLSSSAAVALATLLGDLNRILTRQQDLTQQLQSERDLLESRVESRTAELQRKTAQLEAAMRTAREISMIQDPAVLLQNAVDLIREYFSFYHAGIFLVDENNEYAVLRAATGKAGEQMIANKHQLKIGMEGIVGYVVFRGIPRIAQEVEGDAVHFKNPYLPDTRSEVALPLQVGGKVIGALDVQSVEEGAFQQEDLQVLQSIADQLAVAIDKAQLVSNLQAQINQLESEYQAFTRRSWRYHLKKSSRHYAFRVEQNQLLTEFPIRPEARRALDQHQIILSTYGEDEEDKKAALAVPIRMRDETLGVINLRFDAPSVPKEIIDMVEVTTNRLALALDNARLLEDVRERAERERLVTDISASVRASTDIEKILMTAAEQIGQKMGVREVRVHLKSEKS